MPVVKQPINPDVLAWAIEQAGVTKAELARELGISYETLESWLGRRDEPGLTQLKDIAKKLRRPTSFFFLSRAPQTAAVGASFRKPLGGKGTRPLSRDEIAELRSAQRRQKVAIWAAKRAGQIAPLRLPRREESPRSTALVVRNWLQWDVQSQVGATSKSAITKLLRRLLEEHGILVLLLQMSKESCRGFSIYDRNVPLIALNGTSQTAAARTFTLLHELGHLMAHERAVCGSPNDEEERWCDKFAAAFLIPEAHLREYLTSKGLEHVESDDINVVRLISQRYKASFQCVALRLVDLQLASWALYDAVRNHPLELESGFGGEPQTTMVRRLREYGTTFPRLILSARDRGDITEIDARKYLNVNGEQLVALQRRLAEQE